MKPPKLCRHLVIDASCGGISLYSLRIDCGDCARVAQWLCDAYKAAVSGKKKASK